MPSKFSGENNDSQMVYARLKIPILLSSECRNVIFRCLYCFEVYFDVMIQCILFVSMSFFFGLLFLLFTIYFDVKVYYSMLWFTVHDVMV